ncbi:MAG: hypothetical protein KGJ09_07045 [Candidatus Omnitrophica bacterium]|nr:hypothetical protein [Candidatus Omnitrophota bacterium]MDE2231520.1 hypothetical protein [Candidatus Omnitrophota bacterium]
MKKDKFVLRATLRFLAAARRANEGIASRRASDAEAVRALNFQRNSGRVAEAPSERGSAAAAEGGKNRPWSERNKFVLLVIFSALWAGASFAGQTPDAWQTLKGEHFVVYYRPDVPDDFAQTTMDSAENALQRITDNMGIIDDLEWAAEKRIKIYVYSDHDDFVTNGHQALWSHGAALVRLAKIVTYPEAGGFFDAILPHELGHIVFRHDIGLSAAVPLWFEEGVAIYQEKAKRLGSDKLVREAIKNGQFIPLSRLTGMRLYRNSNSQIVDLFYTESASAVHYLITQWGSLEFTMLLNELKSGTPFDKALHKVYLRFETIDDLNQAWVDYLQVQS